MSVNAEKINPPIEDEINIVAAGDYITVMKKLKKL
jgi:hypothetical protein